MDIKKLSKKFAELHASTIQTKEVEVHGMKVKLRPLQSIEEIQLHKLVSDLSGIEYLLRLKQETLGFSISSIDDEELEEEITDDSGSSMPKSLYLKKNFLSKLPQQATDILFNAYLVLGIEMEEKSKSQIKFDNADLINKYLEEENVKKVSETVDKIIEKQEN
jgi:hypothetical protein